MTLPPPVRKKYRGVHKPGDPLPVPIASLTGFPCSATTWSHYDGFYEDGVVTVTDLNQVASLWHKGYFGLLKGTDQLKDDHWNDQSYGFEKKWELLEAEGIKEVSYFKRPPELEDDFKNTEQSFRDTEQSHDNSEGVVCVDPDKLCTKEGVQEHNDSRDADDDDDNLQMNSDVTLHAKSDVILHAKSDVILHAKSDVTLHAKSDDHLQTKYNDTSQTKHDQDQETEDNEIIKGDMCMSENSVHVNNKEVVEEEHSDVNCKTILKFESDHISHIFFDDFDPSTSTGYLELMLEEAMFLSYALGCLVVQKDKILREEQKTLEKKSKVKSMTIDQMWRTFVGQDPKFVARYAVYHHFRTKGWVVRSGLKFGADFLLYPVGPPFYHAQFTVMIQSIWSDNSERDSYLSSREISWTSFTALERLSTHVKKTPLICYVIRPRSLTQNKLSAIDCLKSLTIKEVLLSRWDTSAASDNIPEDITLD